VKLPLRVDLEMTLSQAAAAMGAKTLGSENLPLSGVALDTRALRRGDLFFALRAARDGHDFVADARKAGAAAVVVEREVAGAGPSIRVPDSLRALHDLARSVRERWSGTVVAISGSNGKTTTKEMTSALLASDRPTLKAPGTWNNHLGVPLTLLMLRPDRRAAVLEMGMNAPGELRTLGSVAGHDVAVLTNVGPAHLERFGSLEGVAKAKGELFESLRPEGVAVVNLDDRRISAMATRMPHRRVTVSMVEAADVTARILRELDGGGYRLGVRYGSEELELETPFVGIHNVSNLLCALGAAFAVGVPARNLEKGMTGIEPPDMRLQVIRLRRGIRIVNDGYNANPASMAVALEVTRSLASGRVLAAVGDMMELGDFSPRAHRDIGIQAAALRYAGLFILGQFAGDVRQGAIQGGVAASAITVALSREGLAERIAGELQPGDTLLVKGSRGMRMEELTARIEELVGREEEK
jgi:UDP-N-acetylmuramoyl-tripeptide--D-alanyl-D-alanine ligase